MADILSIPASGAFIHQMTSGEEVALGFSPETTTLDLAKEGNDLLMNFESGSSIVLKDFFTFMDATLDFGGARLDAESFIASFAPDLATAAGEGSTGRLGAYSDDAGNLIDGVDRLGVQGRPDWGGGTARAESAVEGESSTPAAPAPREVSISISTADINEGDGTISFGIQLSLPPTGTTPTIVEVTTFNSVTGETTTHYVTVDANGYGVLTIANDNTEDIYLDPSHVTLTVVGVTGGNYDKVTVGQSATAQVLDTIDTTTAEIATVVPDGNGGVTVTVQLTNPISDNPAPQTDVPIQVVVNGVTQTVIIPAGSTSSSITFDNVLDSSPYAGVEQEVAISLGVSDPNAGNFEALAAQGDGADFSFNLPQPPSEVPLTVSVADGVEGSETVPATVNLGEPPAEAGTITLTVTDPDGNVIGTVTVNLEPGKSEYVVDVPHGNEDDVYKDASEITVTVSVEGGGYALPVVDASDSAHIEDTIDTTYVSVTAVDTVEGAEHVQFNVSMSNPPQEGHPCTVIVTVDGQDYSVAIGADGAGTLLVDNPNTEDIYLDASSMTATVKEVIGGNYEDVGGIGASATANIADTIDTTTAEIFEVVPDGNGGVTVTVQLTNPISDNPAPQTDVPIQVVVNGVTQTVVIPAGSTSSSITFDNVLDSSPYAGAEQEVAISLGVSDPNAGNFEALAAQGDGADFSFNLPQPPSEVFLAISVADGVEGSDTVPATINLGSPPAEAGTITLTVTDPGGNAIGTVTVNLEPGKSEYTVDVPHGNAEDIYLDASEITVTASVEGGGYALPVAGASDTANIADTIDTTTAEIFAVVPDGNGGVTVTVQLTNPISDNPAPQTDVPIQVVVNGVTQTVVIPAGSTSSSITFDNVLDSSPYAGAEQEVAISLGVSDPNAGNFEALAAQGDGADFSFNLPQPPSEVFLAISVADGIEGGDTVPATINLGVAPTEAGVITLTVTDPGGNAIGTVTVNLEPGQSEYVVDVPHGNAEDIYLDASEITVTATVEGGGYALPVAGASDTANIADTIDTTTAEIALGTDESGQLVVTISLTNEDGLDTSPGEGQTTTVNFTVNGQTYSADISGKDTSVSVSLPGALNYAGNSTITVNAQVTGFTSTTGEFEAKSFGSELSSFPCVPVAPTVELAGAVPRVSEAYLPGGTQEGKGSGHVAEVQYRVDLGGGDAETFTIGGNSFTVNAQGQLVGDFSSISVANGEVTGGSFNPQTGLLSLTYQLTEAYEGHQAKSGSSGEDKSDVALDVVRLEVSVLTQVGVSNTVTGTVGIIDDAPVRFTPIAADVPDGDGASIVGDLNALWGADGQHADTPAAFAPAGPSITLGGERCWDTGHTSDGNPVYYKLADNGATIEGVTYQNGVFTTVFAAHLDAESNSYSFEMYGSLNVVQEMIFADMGAAEAGNKSGGYICSGGNYGFMFSTPPADQILAKITASSTINTSTNGIGTGNQFFSKGDWAQLEFPREQSVVAISEGKGGGPLEGTWKAYDAAGNVVATGSFHCDALGTTQIEPGALFTEIRLDFAGNSKGTIAEIGCNMELLDHYPELNLPVQIMDGDGDTASSSITITLSNPADADPSFFEQGDASASPDGAGQFAAFSASMPLDDDQDPLLGGTPDVSLSREENIPLSEEHAEDNQSGLIIYASSGDEVMQSSGGGDTFVWTQESLGGVDHVMDFSLGDDKLFFEDMFDHGSDQDTGEQIGQMLDDGQLLFSITHESQVALTYNGGDNEQVVHLSLADPLDSEMVEDLHNDDDTAKAQLLQQILQVSM
ncbi:MAG: hypothetical protein FWG17_07220 [Desulfovibrionaceae bacterium]|nr:hypothetical protein [Desulfovibrionaceae bacterium]